MNNYFENFSPVTGKKICDIEIHSNEEINKKILKAETAFLIWKETSNFEKSKILYRCAEIIRSKQKELAQIEVLDNGKAIKEAIETDIPSAADAFQYFAGVAQTLRGSHVQLAKSFSYQKREPLGLCVGIGAWNYPFQIAAWKAAPALACGNAMLFKPSELTPLSAVKLEEILLEAGLPEGLFQIVQGGKDVGEYLCKHPKISKISLTGSSQTGIKIFENSATSLKKLSLELGGKSPLIIFDDTDLDKSVDIAMMANFYTQGEICSNGTRVFVHKNIKNKFTEILLKKVQQIQLGDPFNEKTTMGALISRQHYEKVNSYILSGIEQGARLIYGGHSPIWNKELEHLKNGHYIMPTIFDNCLDNMKIVREEIFGPVLSLLEFSTEEEVIARANDTKYGLAAGVLTKDIQRAHRVVDKLNAGICWINNYNLTPIEIPFGGFKMSGIGKENGLEVVEQYTQIKTVYVEMNN